MNPDSPIDPRSALESSLSALLLGELPHEQAAALHQKLAQDPELAALYQRLKHTINLVRETVSSPAQETADQPSPLKLSEDRRQKLLARFKTVAPKEFAAPPRRRVTFPQVVSLGIAAGFVLMLGGIVITYFTNSKGGPSLAFHTWSLKNTDPEALSQLAAATKSRDEGLSENERSERLLRRPISPPATPPPAPVPFAGTAIVLPESGEPAETASAEAFRSRYVGRPEPAPVERGAPAQTPSGTSGGGGTMELRVFRLANADASQTADQLTQLFPERTAPTSGSQSPTTSFSSFRGGFGGQAGNATAAAEGSDRTSEKGRLLAVADPRTSSLVVTAPKALMPQIADMVTELDSEKSQEVVGFYDLHNASVQDAYKNLQDLFQRSNVRQQNKDQNAMLVQNSPLYKRETGNAQSTSGDSTDAAAAERQHPGIATSDSLFSRPKAVTALEAGRPVNNDGRLQALGEPAPATVAGRSGSSVDVDSLFSGGLTPATPPVTSVTPLPNSLNREIAHQIGPVTTGPSSLALTPTPAAEPTAANAPVQASSAASVNDIALPVPALTPAAGTQAGSLEVTGVPTETHSEVLAGVRIDSRSKVPNRPSAEPRKGAELLKERAVAEVPAVEPPPAQETAVNEAPDRQSNAPIAAKPAGASRADNKALGFDWYLGNVLAANGKIKAQGGTPPNASQPATEGKPQTSPLKDVELAWSDSSQHQKQGNVGPADGSVQGLSLALSKKVQEAPATGSSIEFLADQTTAKAPSPLGEATHAYSWTPERGYQSYAAGAGSPVSSNSDADRVPILGDVPAMGRLFHNNRGGVGVGDRVQIKAEEKVNSVELAYGVGQAQQENTRVAQTQVDRLRRELNISDAVASADGPSPLLTAETLRKLESLRTEGKTELVQQETLLRRLKEQNKTPAPEGLVTSLEARTAALKKSLDDLEQEVGKAATNDMLAAARSRPYFEAKREMEELQRFRKAAPVSDKNAATEVTQARQSDIASPKPAVPAPIPQPEVPTTDNAFSTFSLNVSDVSFKLAAASLEKGVMPEPGNVRSEEFINAFDYRDPEPPPGVPVAFAWERAQYPFAQNRDLLRFSIKTAAQGREQGRPMNIVLLLDTSGSMERADRVQIIHEALRVLAAQLQPQDKFSVVTFARTARLWVDGVPGNQAAQVVGEVSGITPQGGTNLEDAMNLAYQTAQRHYLANGINRVVLLTDGAANLGDVEPETLKQKVEANRKQGIALDCFGIGWEGYNDDLLEVLSRNGDGRYGFINTPEEATTGFAAQLAGALQVAASDVKVQVEFNPARVTAYRQIGYAKHQLTKEQFRDNTVAAAQIGAAESGNALYVVEVNPAGQGPLATVRVRYRVPGTSDVHEHEWPVPYTGNATPLDQSAPAIRVAATASAFSEWLVSSPYATEVSPDRLLGYLNGVPEVYGADARPKKLEWMVRQAKSIAGK